MYISKVRTPTGANQITNTHYIHDIKPHAHMYVYIYIYVLLCPRPKHGINAHLYNV